MLLGVLTSSLLASLLLDWGIVGKTPFDLTKDTANTNLIRLMLSGALVGLGTELGSGCTSGHGLCGLPRFSLRSFTAVIIFLVTAIFTSTSFLHKQIPRAP